MLAGIVVGSVAALSGMAYAKLINRRHHPFRDLEEGSTKPRKTGVRLCIHIATALAFDNSHSPPFDSPFWKTILTAVAESAVFELSAGKFDRAIPGDKNVALTIAASIGLYTLYIKKKNDLQR